MAIFVAFMIAAALDRALFDATYYAGLLIAFIFAGGLAFWFPDEPSAPPPDDDDPLPPPWYPALWGSTLPSEPRSRRPAPIR